MFFVRRRVAVELSAYCLKTEASYKQKVRVGIKWRSTEKFITKKA